MTFKGMSSKKVNQLKTLLEDFFEEYSSDLSTRYKDEISDILVMLENVRDDLKERGK